MCGETFKSKRDELSHKTFDKRSHLGEVCQMHLPIYYSSGAVVVVFVA